jgi:two-component system CheB/CheR fusion protein
VDVPAEAISSGPDYVVGIGSSAGGLEALEGLVSAIEPGHRASIVIAQHLAPQHPSLLTDLLARNTSLKVVTAVDGTPLEAGVITIAPPGHDVIVTTSTVRVVDAEAGIGPRPSIDRFLDSIAQAWGEHGVGVILSGTGSDGAYGMRAIKAADGLTIVQSPQTAKFEGMPRAALAFGVGDLVLPPTEIGERISHLGAAEADWIGELLPIPGPDVMTSIIAELRRSTGIDFSRYKESTLQRQIQRRMAILQVSEIDDYLPLILADQSESLALMNGMLVTVSSFFRDAEAFAALREQLRPVVSEFPPTEQMRIWVPGCATGEEVYSLAMIVSSLLGDPIDLAQRLKIFGTDLDEAALGVARRGAYPSVSMSSVPEELRPRYLVPSPQGIEVTPELRDVVVFARHNVAQDPPFARLDVISCRNTLIYFTAPLQHRVLQMFAYSLRPGGLLFLGASEALAADTAGFDTIDATHRIFVRTREMVTPRKAYLPGPVPRLRQAAPQPLTLTADSILPPDTHLAVLEALARTRNAPCLVLNERHEVVEVIGDVQQFCRIPQGRPSVAIASLLRPEFESEARALLLVLRAKGERVSSRAVTVAGSEHPTRMVAGPLIVGDRVMALLEFLAEDIEVAAPIQMGERGPEFDAELARLEQELVKSQESLEGSLSDLETAHEELLASNEELQASSEELQSSYEELATSNEELQASNEELSTANHELRSRADELDRSRRESDAQFLDFVRVTDALEEVVWQRDPTLGRLLYVSRGVEDLLATTVDSLGDDADRLDDFIVQEDRDRVMSARGDGRRPWSVEFRVQATDGTVRWVTERASLVTDVTGGDRVVATMVDITEQVRSMEREHDQRIIFEAVFRAPFVGVAIIDSDERILLANDQFCDLLGYSADSVVGMPIAALGYVAAENAGDDAPSVGAAENANGNGNGNGNGWHHQNVGGLPARQLIRRDGTTCWANVEVHVLDGGVGKASSMFIVRDVTELREQTVELSRRASTDAGTGLLNRDHFQQTLARHMARCETQGTSVALIWVDIDQFKDVNDRYGHAAGDEVLRCSAERMESTVRSNDIVGRLGGDEFGVILAHFESASELEVVLERMLMALRQPISVGEAEVVISGSLGVAVYPEDGLTPEDLMRSADAAMYAIKNRTGDGYEYFREDLTREAEVRRHLRSDLGDAIRDEAFSLHYQPILSAVSGEVWGVEALMRWHRDGEIVAAEEFIAFCESTGQIRALAPLTFRRLREDLEVFRASGSEVGRACVNVSVAQLEDKDFTSLMKWWPSPTGLSGVVMEITESIFLPDHQRSFNAIELLSRLGAEISVDDFGSGYSNLMLLEALSPKCIKLDKSFLGTRAGSRNGRELITAAVDMGHALQSIVIAEGIETDDQLNMVREIGADLVQGYAIAMPMPRDELIEWLRDRSPVAAGPA